MLQPDFANGGLKEQHLLKQAVICVGMILGGYATTATSDRAEMTRIEQKCGEETGTFQMNKKLVLSSISIPTKNTIRLSALSLNCVLQNCGEL